MKFLEGCLDSKRLEVDRRLRFEAMYSEQRPDVRTAVHRRRDPARDWNVFEFQVRHELEIREVTSTFPEGVTS